MHIFNFNAPGVHNLIAKKMLEIEDNPVTYNTEFSTINLSIKSSNIHIFANTDDNDNKYIIEFVNKIAPCMDIMQSPKTMAFSKKSSISHSAIEIPFAHPAFNQKGTSIAVRRIFVTTNSAHTNAEFTWNIKCSYKFTTSSCIHNFINSKTCIIVDMTNNMRDTYISLNAEHDASVYLAMVGVQKNIIRIRISPCAFFPSNEQLKNISHSKSPNVHPETILFPNFKKLRNGIESILTENFITDNDENEKCQMCNTQLLNMFAYGINMCDSNVIGLCECCIRTEIVSCIMKETKLNVINRVKCNMSVDEFVTNAGMTMIDYKKIQNMHINNELDDITIFDNNVVIKSGRAVGGDKIARILHVLNNSNVNRINIVILDIF